MADSEGTARLAPVAQTERISSLDTLRGIAVLGILLMNIVGFGLPIAAYFNPSVAGGLDSRNFYAWAIPDVLFEGTMRGIFSLLFGASIVLLTDRMENSGAGVKTADVHFRRMLWMMLFGIIHWTLLLWIGEILFAYSICGLLLFVFRKMAPQRLLLIAAVLLALATAGSFAGSQGVPEAQTAAAEASAAKAKGAKLGKEQTGAIEEWKEMSEDFFPPQEKLDEVTAIRRGSYGDAVSGQFEDAYEFQWVHLPGGLFVDMIPMMLIGMALLGLNVLSAKRSARFYAGLMLAGYAVGLPLNLYEASTFAGSGFGLIGSSQAGITAPISRAAMVAGHLGLFLLIIRQGWLKPVQRVLAATGQMALSNYIAQTLICTALFYGFGFDLFFRLERHELFYVVAAIWALELTWSPLWLRHYRFGPMEWLWRSLTYWDLQPLKR